jgi:hypothetical protein
MAKNYKEEEEEDTLYLLDALSGMEEDVVSTGGLRHSCNVPRSSAL